MTNDEMYGAITAQRRRLAERLGSLDANQWSTPSLCAGWRVRDVLGHLLSILEIPLPKFLLGVAKARNFDRYADRVAREFGNRDPLVLLDGFRRYADKRFAPPLIGPIAPLTDLYVHTRDIERPLGLANQLDADVTRSVLSYLCGGKARGFIPRSRTADLSFLATDLGWSAGSGPVVSGPGEAIMMAVTRRSVALDELSGIGVDQLRQRLGMSGPSGTRRSRGSRPRSMPRADTA